MSAEEFINWLLNNNLALNSARDVMSRARRASRYIDLSASCSDEELIFRLTQVPEFQSMSPSVKSQIKRAVFLYRQFLSRVM